MSCPTTQTLRCGYADRSDRNRSLTSDACTGVPPGESMATTTPFAT
jgi:hypothetical protein